MATNRTRSSSGHFLSPAVLVVFMMALVSVLGASTASAQATDVSSSQDESGDDGAQRAGADSERRLMIGGMSGVFTPTGIAGVTVEYTFARYVSVMGGGGVTLIANGERDFGWRFAAGLRGRLSFGRCSLFPFPPG